MAGSVWFLGLSLEQGKVETKPLEVLGIVASVAGEIAFEIRHALLNG